MYKPTSDIGTPLVSIKNWSEPMVASGYADKILDEASDGAGEAHEWGERDENNG
jgi:hypothetical protein